MRWADRTCEHCGKEIPGSRKYGTKTCNVRCRVAMYRKGKAAQAEAARQALLTKKSRGKKRVANRKQKGKV